MGRKPTTGAAALELTPRNIAAEITAHRTNIRAIKADRARRMAAGEQTPPLGDTRRIIRDKIRSGLLLVIGVDTASFRYDYRTRGDRTGRKYEIGPAEGEDAISIDAARFEATTLKAAVAAGRDPFIERVEAREASTKAAAAELTNASELAKAISNATAAGPDGKGLFVSAKEFRALGGATLEQCAHAFHLHGFEHRKDGRAVTDRARKDWLNHVLIGLRSVGALHLKPAELTLDHLNDMKTMLVHAGQLSTARHRVNNIKRLMAWLTVKGALPATPFSAFKAPPPPQARDRVYTAKEMASLWNNADRLLDGYEGEALTIREAKADLLRLLMLIPARRSELAYARVSDFAMEEGLLVWTQVPEANKSRRLHKLPIVGAAEPIIRKWLERRAKEELLLPLTKNAGERLSWVHLTDDIIEVTGVQKFAWHHTRRTFMTVGSEHRIGDFKTADGLLNHSASASTPGAAGAYDWAHRLEARAEMLTAWSALVLDVAEHGEWRRNRVIKSGGNVVLMERAAG